MTAYRSAQLKCLSLLLAAGSFAAAPLFAQFTSVDPAVNGGYDIFTYNLDGSSSYTTLYPDGRGGYNGVTNTLPGYESLSAQTARLESELGPINAQSSGDEPDRAVAPSHETDENLDRLWTPPAGASALTVARDALFKALYKAQEVVLAKCRATGVSEQNCLLANP